MCITQMVGVWFKMSDCAQHKKVFRNKAHDVYKKKIKDLESISDLPIDDYINYDKLCIKYGSNIKPDSELDDYTVLASLKQLGAHTMNDAYRLLLDHVPSTTDVKEWQQEYCFSVYSLYRCLQEAYPQLEFKYGVRKRFIKHKRIKT